MKKWLGVTLILLMLLICGSAAAEWTCTEVFLDGTVCGWVNEDGSGWCTWCGVDEPIHGLNVTVAGKDFMVLKWYGTTKAPLSLLWCKAGTGNWEMQDGLNGNSCTLRGLEEGMGYDVELMVDYVDIIGPATGFTGGVTPTPEPVSTPAPAVESTPDVTAVPESTAVPEPTAAPTAKAIAVGDIITFGHYPQTAAGDDNTPIKWQVLEVQGNKALVISKYGLDAQPYHVKPGDITWEKSTIRSWLNGYGGECNRSKVDYTSENFINRAFTAEDQMSILLTDVDNSRPQRYWRKVDGGKNTQDKLFLLSYAEANRYFGVKYWTEDGAGENMLSRVHPTDYAVSRGAGYSSAYADSDGEYAGWWWLRSPGYNGGYASNVYYDGSLDRFDVTYASGSIRPAFWLNLDSAKIE